MAKLRAYAEREGRDPASLGIEVWVSNGAGDEASWREEFKEPPPAHRLALILQAHLTALERYRYAVADLL